MSMRELFKNYPQIDETELAQDTEFWEWLNNQDEVDVTEFIPTLKTYLAEHGFDIENQIIDQEQLRHHRVVHGYFWHVLYENRKGE